MRRAMKLPKAIARTRFSLFGPPKQIPPCAWCDEELAMLQTGEKILPFRLCDHYIHQECLKIYAEEQFGEETASSALTCPKCSKVSSHACAVEAAPSEVLSSNIPVESGTAFAKLIQSQSQIEIEVSMPHHVPNVGEYTPPADPVYAPFRDSNDVLALRIDNPTVSITSDHSSLDKAESQDRIITAVISIKSPSRPVDHHLRKQPQSPIDSLYSIINSYTKAPTSPTCEKNSFLEWQMINAEEKLLELRERITEWNGISFDLAGRLLLWDPVHVGTDTQSEAFECCLFEQSIIFITHDLKRSNLSTKSQYIVKASIPISQILYVKDTLSQLPLALTLVLTGNRAFICKYKDLPTKHKWIRALRTHMDRLADSRYKQLPPHSLKPLPAVPSHTSCEAGSLARRSVATAVNAVQRNARGSTTRKRSLNNHIPVDIVLIVPAGNYLGDPSCAAVTKTIFSIIRLLGAYDRFGLILYGSPDHEPCVKVNFCHKADEYIRIIQSLQWSGNQTHPPDFGKASEEALEAAIGMFRSRRNRPCLSHVIFISDLVEVSQRTTELVRTLRDHKVMLHTLGLTAAHSGGALAVCAGITFGTYTYIVNLDELEDQVTRILCGIFSISHTDMILDLSIPRLNFRSSCQVLEISGCVDLNVSHDRQSAKLRIPYLCHGDALEILVRLKIKTGPVSYNTIELLQVNTSWLNVSTNKLKSCRFPSILHMPIRDKLSQVLNTALITRRVELVVSNILSRVLFLMSQNRVQATARLLTECRLVLVRIARVYNLDENDYIWQLDCDLSKVLESIESPKQFRLHGSKFTIQLHLALLYQRAFVTQHKSTLNRYAKPPSVDHDGQGF